MPVEFTRGVAQILVVTGCPMAKKGCFSHQVNPLGCTPPPPILTGKGEIVKCNSTWCGARLRPSASSPRERRSFYPENVCMLLRMSKKGHAHRARPSNTVFTVARYYFTSTSKKGCSTTCTSFWPKQTCRVYPFLAFTILKTCHRGTLSVLHIIYTRYGFLFLFNVTKTKVNRKHQRH